MLRNPFSIRFQTGLFLAVTLICTWLATFYELDRSKASYLRETEASTVFQAQAFAENTLSTIKRINEILLVLRIRWRENPENFAQMIQRRQEAIDDIAFQLAIIDADGYLAYSNLAKNKERIYLGEREHFRVHKESSEDRLFISKPLKGKISGKWSIQFTRPIFEGKRFRGVMVVSVSPDIFSAFNEKMRLGSTSTGTLVRDNGQIMARHPLPDSAFLEKVIADVPFLAPEAPLSGNYISPSKIDGIKRVFGYYRLPDYGLNFVVGHAYDEVLAPYFSHRGAILGATLTVSALVVLLVLLLNRSLGAQSRMAAQLQESQAMMRSAVDTIGEAFVIYGKDDRLAFCNEQYRRCYETSADLLVPGSLFEDVIRIGTARGQYQIPEGLEEAWIEERLAAHRTGADMIQRLDDGRWVRIRESRTPEGFIVGFRIDITELYQAKEAAEAANEAKSRFLATMSHEIRTPLNGILGMAQLLRTPDLEEAERQDFAQTILNSGQILLTLLNDILDLSKVEAGKLELEYSEVHPARLLEETATLFAEGAKRKGLAMEAAWRGPRNRCYQADSVRLRQMLSNFINNAIKFTPQGTVSIEANEVDVQGNTAVLEFSVIDTGMGIPEAKRSRLFQPFSQVDQSITRDFGGTGLGLSIVRSLAQQMGGAVGVESTVGRGSRFWFRIRAEIAAPVETKLAVREEKAVAAPSPRVANQILVVEDNPINRKVIEAMLTRQGYACQCLFNGREALDAISGGLRPDLIFMDCQMPVMDGLEATRQIRAWEKREAEAGKNAPRLTIIALTADAFAEDRKHCLAAGMDDFLTKPIDIGKLRGIVGQWLHTPPSGDEKPALSDVALQDA